MLQFLVILFLESINVKYEEMAVVAADPGEVVVDTAAKQSMTGCLFHSDGLQRLSVINMQLVTFAS